MAADGQHPHRALPDPGPNDPPTFRYFSRWSANGQRLLFYESKWFRDGDVKRFIIQRIGGGTHKITDINDRLGNHFLIAGASWMEQDRVILFALKFLDKLPSNYNLYRYGLETRSLRRLTREASDEEWPDWTEGSLSISPHGKLTTLWGEIKRTEH